MSDEMAGTSQAYFNGCKKGYEDAIQDIMREINQIRYNFQSLSLPIIEGIMSKLEKKNNATSED